jgi:flagellar hook-length control protein FliK
MNCADVMTLARAAPEPVPPSRTIARDDGNSFNTFLEAVATDHPTYKEDATKMRTSKTEETRDDHKYAESESVEQNRVPEKPKAKPESDEKVEVDDSAKETIAAVVAAQVLSVVAPTVLPEETSIKPAAPEATIPIAVVSVQPNSQSAVIQLPDTEPQPLPDELKQAVQQPKVEVKDFQTLVDAAAKNLETQAVKPVEVPSTATPVVEVPVVKTASDQDQAVKLVDVDAKPEDLAALETARTNGGLYALTAAKSENLIQPKTLPMIREISQEVVNLAREQGQSMRIQVHPENMGKIDLRLISNSDGLRVVMTAEIPATAKLLENHMNQLQRSLTEAGLSVSGMSVNSQGAQGQSNNQTSNQTQHTVLKTSNLIFKDEVLNTTPVVNLTSSSGLDYRV